MPARIEVLQYPAVCFDCGAPLQPGEQVRAYDAQDGRTTYYCLNGHKNRPARRQGQGRASQAARPVAPASKQAVPPRYPAQAQAPAQAQGWVGNPEALWATMQALSIWALDNNQVLRSLVAEVSRVAEALEAILGILISRGEGEDAQAGQ
jgi:hypothetical protein